MPLESRKPGIELGPRQCTEQHSLLLLQQNYLAQDVNTAPVGKAGAGCWARIQHTGHEGYSRRDKQLPAALYTTAHRLPRWQRLANIY